MYKPRKKNLNSSWNVLKLWIFKPITCNKFPIATSILTLIDYLWHVLWLTIVIKFKCQTTRFSFDRVSGKCPFPSDLHTGRSCDYELHTMHRYSIYIAHDWLLGTTAKFRCRAKVKNRVKVQILNWCFNVLFEASTNCASESSCRTTSSSSTVEELFPSLWNNSTLSPPSIFSTGEADNTVRGGGIAAAAWCQVRVDLTNLWSHLHPTHLPQTEQAEQVGWQSDSQSHR